MDPQSTYLIISFVKYSLGEREKCLVIKSIVYRRFTLSLRFTGRLVAVTQMVRFVMIHVLLCASSLRRACALGFCLSWGSMPLEDIVLNHSIFMLYGIILYSPMKCWQGLKFYKIKYDSSLGQFYYLHANYFKVMLSFERSFTSISNITHTVPSFLFPNLRPVKVRKLK